MEQFRNVLIKDLLAVATIMLIIIIVCIVGFLVVKRLKLEQYLYILISILLLITLLFGGQHLVAISLDLHFESIETYVGTCEFPSRDTIVLNDKNKTRLYSAVSVPNTSDNITIMYFKRSKIVVGFEK